MRITAKVDYACRAVLALSRHWPNKEPLPISAIGQEYDIPIKFLTHILIELRQINLVVSTRGKSGGYILSKAPSAITLYDVVSHFGEWGAPEYNGNDKASFFTDVWAEVQKAFERKLKEITFEDLKSRSQKKPPLTYTI